MDFSAVRQTLLTGNLNAKNKDTEKRDAANVFVEKGLYKCATFLFHVMMWNLFNSTFDVELISFHIIPHLMWNSFNST